jgi:hypothetical protein
MPGTVHEALVALLRDHPEVLRELLVRAGVAVGVAEVVAGAESFPEPGVAVHVADVCLVDRGRDGAVAAAYVVEVQRQIDDDKAHVWPFLVTAAAARHGAPAWLVVIATERGVAR